MINSDIDYRFTSRALVSHSLVILFICLTVFSNRVMGQETRTLEGEVSLDLGPATKDLLIEITVSNHLFVVIPPTFTIIRPVTSRETRRVIIERGESSVNYFVDNIITDPVDYSIEFSCINCTDAFRTQYYTPTGNRFGLVNSAYIDPEALGASVNVVIVTDASIEGEISLINNAVALRDLEYELVVASNNSPQVVYRRLSNIRMRAGQNSVAYRVTGLRRRIGPDLFLIQLRCTNCRGKSARTQSFDGPLSPALNHTGIDFISSDEAAINIAPVIDLLLR